MHLGLSVYGTVFSMGLHPKAAVPTWTPVQLMQKALDMKLTGVEVPVGWLNEENVSHVRRFADEHGLFVVVDTGGYDPDYLDKAMKLASRVGAKTVRTVVGGADFGGDRRKLAGHWSDFLQGVLTGLTEATHRAEAHGMQLAVENHQDLASEELIWLCETIGSDHIGINLDTGNPLATAEEPMDFFRRVLPFLKNVHLKDYTVHLGEEGYRLARCPLGQGVIDFPALFRLLEEHSPDMTMTVEMGALQARHTRVLADDFWPEYPQRSAAQLARLMRFVLKNASHVTDWRTPYERGESPEAISRYEEHQLATSLAYLSGVEFLKNE